MYSEKEKINLNDYDLSDTSKIIKAIEWFYLCDPKDKNELFKKIKMAMNNDNFVFNVTKYNTNDIFTRIISSRITNLKIKAREKTFYNHLPNIYDFFDAVDKVMYDNSIKLQNKKDILHHAVDQFKYSNLYFRPDSYITKFAVAVHDLYDTISEFSAKKDENGNINVLKQLLLDVIWFDKNFKTFILIWVYHLKEIYGEKLTDLENIIDNGKPYISNSVNPNCSNRDFSNKIDFFENLVSSKKMEVYNYLYQKYEDKFYMVKNEYKMEEEIIKSYDRFYNQRSLEQLNKNYTMLVDETVITFFSEICSRYGYRMVTSLDVKLNTVYFITNGKDTYLIAKHKVTKNPLLIFIFNCEEGGSCLDLKYLTEDVIDKKEFVRLNQKVKAVHFKPKEMNYEILTEGLVLGKDGTIKFTLKYKSSYMDEYMKIHRVLDINNKTKNLEGLKYGLVEMFTLINDIEKKYTKAELKKDQDALKARMFAIGDFKTYLKEVEKYDKSFKFLEFYENNYFGKAIFKITPDQINGAKKLFRIVML